MVYQPSGFKLPTTTEFPQPEPDVRSESLRHTQKIARSSRPGGSTRRTSRNAMNKYRKSLLNKSPERSQPLPRRRTMNHVPSFVRSTQRKRLQSGNPRTMRRARTARNSRNSRNSRTARNSNKRNTKKRPPSLTRTQPQLFPTINE